MSIGLQSAVRCGLLGAIVLHGALAQGATRAMWPGDNIRYSYTLVVDNDTEVCAHMGLVFNNNFRHLWKLESLMPGEDTYGAQGKYAFPKLPGVQHDRRVAFDIALSKVPSSKEFDAIEWREGRINMGQPSDLEASSRLAPMLLAYFDLDNDGQSDTVMKHGFTTGYGDILRRGSSDDYIDVWRGVTTEAAANASLWVLYNEVPDAQRPITANGQYLRPFIYNEHAYLAQYEMVHEDDISEAAAPFEIAAEIMSVLDVRYTGERNKFTQAPEWTNSIVCKYEMNQVD